MFVDLTLAHVTLAHAVEPGADADFLCDGSSEWLSVNTQGTVNHAT